MNLLPGVVDETLSKLMSFWVVFGNLWICEDPEETSENALSFFNAWAQTTISDIISLNTTPGAIMFLAFSCSPLLPSLVHCCSVIHSFKPTLKRGKRILVTSVPTVVFDVVPTFPQIMSKQL